MKEQFSIKPELQNYEANKLFYIAKNGQGYSANNELHLIANYHYVYYFQGKTGWYMRNPQTNVDWYLGVGASPTIAVEDIQILDKEYFDSILIEQGD